MEAGRISAELVESDTPVDSDDVMISATEKVEDQQVVTRHTEGFERVEGVEGRGYRDRSTVGELVRWPSAQKTR